MIVSRSSYTDSLQFFGQFSPTALRAEYGSPVYVYNEVLLRQACSAITQVLGQLPGSVVFSSKANSNPHLLRIVREEGLMADAMSPGEVAMLIEAGFTRDEIVYVCNNVSPEELRFAKENAFLVSVDSLDQLESFGQVNPDSNVMIRLNPGIGAGHHKKVITAGKETKFGMSVGDIAAIKAIAERYGLRIVGLNQHVGSLFMDAAPYLEAVEWLLDKWHLFPDVQYLDFGGGFGIPYGKYNGEARFDTAGLGESLKTLLTEWVAKTGYNGRFLIEPGRFVAAESALLLGTVQAVKENSGTRYVGTDLGFSVLARPMLYDAFHDIEVYADALKTSHEREERLLKEQTIVGNICESGDILAKDRLLPELRKGDCIGVLDAGAYGHVMSSNYTKRLRPAEVLLTADGEKKLIRRRDTLEDLLDVYRV